jgi:hypothetical protein
MLDRGDAAQHPCLEVVGDVAALADRLREPELRRGRRQPLVPPRRSPSEQVVVLRERPLDGVAEDGHVAFGGREQVEQAGRDVAGGGLKAVRQLETVDPLGAVRVMAGDLEAVDRRMDVHPAHVHALVAVAVVVQEQRAERRASGLGDVDQKQLQRHGGHRTGTGTDGSVASPRASACSARSTSSG